MLPLKTEPQGLMPSLSPICCGAAKAMPIAPAPRRMESYTLQEHSPDRGDYTWMVRRFTETSAVMLTNAIAIK
jgi:hypothetical protein